MKRSLVHPGAPWIAVALLLVMTSAAFAESAATPVPVTDDRPGIVTPESPAAACILEPGPLSLIAYVYSAPLHYNTLAWRIPRQSCVACPAPYVLDVKEILFRIRWTTAPCSASVDVSIVGAKGDPQCPTPDTTLVLCGPETYTIVRSGADNYETYPVDFDEGCCIFQDAFVLLRFHGLGDCVNPTNGFTSGLSATTTPAVACQQFVELSDYFTDMTDWTVAAPGARSLWMQMDADCCSATPTHKQSWGRVKTLYR